MKTFPIAIISLLGLSCSKSNQPKCADTNVEQLLKEICAEDYKRDTSEISISSVRTVSTNEQFNSCECAATLKADDKKFSFLYFQKIDEEVEYTAQITDDGKEITVKVH